MEKECFKCHRVLDISEFYEHKKMKDGHLNKCKECTKSDVSGRYRVAFENRARYERERNKRQERKEQVRKHTVKHRLANPEKYHAHSLVSSAIRRGLLVRPDKCSLCGETCKPHAHHEDYLKPLDVVWVCVKCHRKITDRKTF